jgi:glycosyltransferase involved in cell wall biosynthesis
VPKFSIIMQSYLGHYEGAATNREEKLKRAVNSVIKQTFQDWELIVIADGCEKTFDIIEQNFIDDKRIECTQIRKQTMWSGAPRNYGISIATGEYIIYLDSDDVWGEDHLQIVSDNISSYNWAYYNDLVKTKDGHIERECLINIKFQHGTSNIVHKKALGAKWTAYGYGSDDWGLVQHLLQLSSNYGKIKTPQYYVMHIDKMKIDF